MASVPDIDLDFPRDIREKLIVAVTERYGREHAALVATFATYRSRGAIRDVGKALGLPQAELERLARVTDGWDAARVAEEVAALPDAERKLLSRRWRAFQFLTGEIAGLPRHVSQHPGGMVISSRPLWSSSRCSRRRWRGGSSASGTRTRAPTPASSRSTCSGWGCCPRSRTASSRSRDCTARRSTSRASRSTTGTCSRRSRTRTRSACSRSSPARRCRACCGRGRRRSTISPCRWRSCGPGPIQGKAVHPYIEHRRRLREDPSFVYPIDHELLREPLRSTLGRGRLPGPGARRRDLAGRVQRRGGGRAAAGDEPQAQPRRAGGAPAALRRRRGGQRRRRRHRGPRLRQARRLLGLRLPEVARGRIRAARLPVRLAAPPLPGRVPLRAPQRAADGLLPAGQPRARRTAARGGGAAPRRQPSEAAKCALQPCDDQSQGCALAVRIGLAYVASLGEDDAAALVAERDANGLYATSATWRAVPRCRATRCRRSCAGGACDAFGRRRDLLWELGLATRPRSVEGTRGQAKQLPLELDPTVATPELRDLTRWERMLADYRETGLSVGDHPLALLRPHLPSDTLTSVELLHDARHGAQVSYAGLAIARQRPSTANGIVFMLLEDEHDQVNLIVPSASTSSTGRSFAPSRCCSSTAASSGWSATATCWSHRWRASRLWPAAWPSRPRSSPRSRGPTTSGTAERVRPRRSHARRGSAGAARSEPGRRAAVLEAADRPNPARMPSSPTAPCRPRANPESVPTRAAPCCRREPRPEGSTRVGHQEARRCHPVRSRLEAGTDRTVAGRRSRFTSTSRAGSVSCPSYAMPARRVPRAFGTSGRVPAKSRPRSRTAPVRRSTASSLVEVPSEAVYVCDAIPPTRRRTPLRARRSWLSAA